MFDNFDPARDEHLGEVHALVFPDADALIAETEAKYGVPDAGYRVSRVPNTQVYVMYGIDEAAHKITLVCIRTYRGASN